VVGWLPLGKQRSSSPIVLNGSRSRTEVDDTFTAYELGGQRVRERETFSFHNPFSKGTAMNVLSPLEQLDQKLAVVRDRVRGVALGRHTGFYLYGRPGTSKTHTVLTTLDREGFAHRYTTGHLTPIGLFDLIDDYNDSLIVLDDMTQILTQPIAVQILLAALGNGPAKGDRPVDYNRSGKRMRTWFSGGIIMVSNFELQGNAAIDAIKSRVHTYNYDPTDEQIAALILSLAERGLHGLTPDVSREVAQHVLAECQRLDYRPEVRLYVDKALRDYELWQDGETETHWRDLVTVAIQERATDLRHELRPVGRAAQMTAETAIAQEIDRSHETRAAKLTGWKEQTGKSERAYYRRLEAA
jgi:hypothetical protein